MPRYDPDRIAALAAGLLEPAEAAALEKEIAGDPRAAGDLATQRRALQALRHAPAPVLSAEERIELRRTVAAALNLEEARPAEAATSRRRVPWRPIAVAAAALTVIAAVVPPISLLSVAGDDQTSLSTVAELSARTEGTATQDGAPLATIMNGEEWEADSGGLGAEFSTMEAVSADADKAIQDLLADPASLIASADADISTCEAEADALLGMESRPAAATLLRETGEMVVWFVSTDGTTVQRLAVFDPVDCVLLASHP
jgi:hypothetical protein